jgi:hypothetical protein
MDIGMPPRPMALTVTGPIVLVCICSPSRLGCCLCCAAADRNTGRGMPAALGCYCDDAAPEAP